MSIIGKIIYSTKSSKDKVEKYQQIIRDNEWNEIKNYIEKNSNFLDVGCGSGYAMMRASKEFNCSVHGVDPEPGAHGVGRYIKKLFSSPKIEKGMAENLPYKDESFEVVYSSHVLEHVQDEILSLKEIKRVLKDDGVLIIGMPTSSMAILNLISQIIFTSHIKVYEFIKNIYRPIFFKNFIYIFRIVSHSQPRANSIWYDINHYRITKWKKMIEREFEIIEVIKPSFYPYPDYPQFFKIHKNLFFTSSVFFISKKKK